VRKRTARWSATVFRHVVLCPTESDRGTKGFREKSDVSKGTLIERRKPGLSPMIRTSKLVPIALLLTSIAGVATADPSAHSAQVAKAAAARPQPACQLDLRVSDITQIFSSAQINHVLAPTYADTIEEIEVEGERVPLRPNTPNVWPTIAAPIWALLHPLQAWRIFVPMPPDQTRLMANEPADFTTGYLEPAAPPY
jgi:hypothetical protein